MRPTDKPSGAVWELLAQWWRLTEGEDPNQVKMAKRLGVSKSTVTNWKLMQTEVGEKHRRRIAAVTNIHPARIAEAARQDWPEVEAHLTKRRAAESAESRPAKRRAAGD